MTSPSSNPAPSASRPSVRGLGELGVVGGVARATTVMPLPEPAAVIWRLSSCCCSADAWETSMSRVVASGLPGTGGCRLITLICV